MTKGLLNQIEFVIFFFCFVVVLLLTNEKGPTPFLKGYIIWSVSTIYSRYSIGLTLTDANMEQLRGNYIKMKHLVQCW